MTEYMLMYSVGPVQTFITQARKTRDLWQGSFLLSKLMSAAMTVDKSSTQVALPLVFPESPVVNDTISNIPNKFVAVFDDPEQARTAARECTKRLQDWWKTTHEIVWKEVVEKSRTSNTETRGIWDRQTNPETLFDIYWIITQRAPEQKYGAWLQYTQNVFDARKRLRNFSAQNEPGEKSTVSGEREVLRGSGRSRSDVKAFWRDLSFKSRLSAKDIDRTGAERLDAIDTIKRFAELSETQAFPSTSSIATASFVQQLLSNVDPATIQDWLDVTSLPALQEMKPEAIPFLAAYVDREGNADKQRKMREILQRDGDCFFEETFTAYRLQKDYAIPDKSSDETSQAKQLARAGKKALAKLFEETTKQGIPRPTPYYALVQIDGDNMGTFIGGVDEPHDHTTISKALSDFSRERVPAIVEQEHPGRLVYAGGDDVLALTPIEGVLELSHNLQKEFGETLTKVAGDRKDLISASAGIAIAHHYTPLNLVLQAARDAEKLAKEHYGRNALVVTIIRRSGGQTRVGCRWKYANLDEDAQPILLFRKFYDLFDQDVLSPKCVYTLLEEAPVLVHLEDSAVQSEIKRVLKRQYSGANEKLLPDPDTGLVDLAKHLADLASAIDQVVANTGKNEASKATELHADSIRYGLVEVLGWLLVMAFLARKVQD